MAEPTKPNGKHSFGIAAGMIGGVGYLILAILTSGLSEAQRYFGVSMVFYILLVAYIELVVKRTVRGDV